MHTVGRSKRPTARGLALVLMLLLSGVVMIGPAAGGAEAATVGDVNLLFSAPGTPARYGRGQAVRIEAGNINFVRGCLPNGAIKGFPDWFQPTADLYVIGGGSTVSDGAQLSDVAGAANTVFGGLGGQFFDVILTATGVGGSKAGSGTYDVVVDECQNERFDDGQDSVIRDAFRVDLSLDVPGFDNGLASFAQMKAQATGQVKDIWELKKMFLYADVTEFAKKTASLGGAMAGGLVGMLGFGVGELVDAFDPLAALRNRARLIVDNSLNQRLFAAYNLSKDPPDPAFQTLDGPQRYSGAIPAGIQTDLARRAAVAATALDQLQAVENAILTTLERYQGAELAGNPVWALRHARALQELVTLHGELIGPARDAVVALDAAYDAAGNGFQGTATHVISSPFNAALSQYNSTEPLNDPEFWNSGLDIDDTRQALMTWRELVQNPGSPGRLFQYLDSGVAAVATLPGWNDDLATWVGEATAGVLPGILGLMPEGDRDPTAVIAPVASAPAGGTIALDGSASSAPLGTTITDWAWDLDGDGLYDDAVGANPSWTIPGYAHAGAPWVIGLQVVSDAGRDATHAAVTITAGNRAPVVTLANPGARVVPDGSATTFTIDGIVDPDGDATTIEWYVDRQLQAGATGTSLTVPDPRYGMTPVEVIVADGPGAITRDGWTLVVLPEVDQDNDNYWAAPGPDCDDTTNQVRPARAEVEANGKDDDCNPATSDDPNATRGGSGSPNPSTFRGMEGDVFTTKVSNWTDPQRTGGGEYTITVNWGDGTTSQQTVKGATSALTTFNLSHQYTTEVDEGTLSYCIRTGAGQLVNCFSKATAIEVGNMRPFVNAADLGTWQEDDEALGGSNTIMCFDVSCSPPGGWLPRDPDGRALIAPNNSYAFTVRHSPVELAEDGYGRGMVELSIDWDGCCGMDDDDIGFVLGYDPGDVYDHASAPDFTPTGTADYVSLIWSGHKIANPGGFTNSKDCNDGHYTPVGAYTRAVAALSRTRGQPLYSEHGLGTFAFPYNPADDASADSGEPQNPGCNDAFGDELLAAPDLTGSEKTGSNGIWVPRAVDATEVLATRPRDTYLFTVDHRPDRIRIWMDDALIADVTAPAGDPFPPGSLGVLHRSQADTRASASAPEPVFSFVQGTPGPITMPLHEPGTDDALTVLVDWGDGEPQSSATLVADPATGHGWFDASAEHAYALAGEHRGQVCASDEEVGSCFPFRVTVANLPPVVDAGPRVVSGADAVLEHPQFSDPGVRDTHTATIDWGDGAVTAGTVDQLQGSGQVAGTHTYAADGTFAVEVCVQDQLGAEGCDTLELEVRATNVAPVALLEVADATAAEPIELGVGFTDENPGDTHTMTFDPGDGSGPAPVADLQDLGAFGQSTVAHTYSAAGTYDVETCVRDGDGAEDCQQGQVTVDAAPCVDAPGGRDLDGDGITDACDPDDDGDTIEDGADADDDNDGFTDEEEAAAGSDPLDPSSVPAPTNRPPDVSRVTTSPRTLWPANNKFVLVRLSGASDPEGDPVALQVTAVVQDEPVGKKAPDAMAGSSPDRVQLRAERDGGRDGRVYTIRFVASDANGGSTTGTVKVGVPHDQGAGKNPVDSGPPHYNSFGS